MQIDTFIYTILPHLFSKYTQKPIDEFGLLWNKVRDMSIAMGGLFSLNENQGDLPTGAMDDVYENGASFYKAGSCLSPQMTIVY